MHALGDLWRNERGSARLLLASELDPQTLSDFPYFTSPAAVIASLNSQLSRSERSPCGRPVALLQLINTLRMWPRAPGLSVGKNRQF